METEKQPQKPGQALKKAKAQARMLILVAAGLSLIASVVLYFAGNENEGIFIFGLFITAIVATACALIVYGIITERREREDLAESRDPGSPS